MYCIRFQFETWGQCEQGRLYSRSLATWVVAGIDSIPQNKQSPDYVFIVEYLHIEDYSYKFRLKYITIKYKLIIDLYQKAVQ